MATVTEPRTDIATRPQSVLELKSVDIGLLHTLESIAEECSLASITESGAGQFVKAFKLAEGIRRLKDAITPAMMGEIMQLQGTRLGFRTDKDPSGGYPVEKVKECLIEALLRGAWPVGNEFNIIAGNMYLTKEFFERVVPTYPGVSNFIATPGTPANVNGGALVPFSATWTFHGRSEMHERTLRKSTDGVQLDERICVRVNQGMGVDAIIGKATRKFLASIYRILSGCDVPEGEADDLLPAPRTQGLSGLKQQLAHDTVGTPPADKQEAPQDQDASIITEARGCFIACRTESEVNLAATDLGKRCQSAAGRAGIRELAGHRLQQLQEELAAKTVTVPLDTDDQTKVGRYENDLAAAGTVRGVQAILRKISKDYDDDALTQQEFEGLASRANQRAEQLK